MKFAVKQFLKMLLQNAVLPCVYGFWRLVYRNREPDLIVFADAHHDEIPYSMVNVHEALLKKGYELTEDFHNYAKMSQVKSALHAVRFMRVYARAKYVFLCDNFLPAASCRKSEKTKVVQLWHSCGLMKKIGYDTAEDIPAHYRGNVYQNYDLLTVSAPCCVEPLTGAMGQAPEIVQPLGVSRTDTYFDEDWRRSCREEFYRQYPQARGKTILLWAPTFRGNAGDPYQVGVEGIDALEKKLGGDYFVIRKVHPHVDEKMHLSNCRIPTERLLPVADLMITDFSSVVFDFLFFGKPFVLYAPDLEAYEQKRGLYIDYGSLTPYVAVEEKELAEQVLAALRSEDLSWLEQQKNYHLASCDGHATERILNYLDL